jgi:hypothetical protein
MAANLSRKELLGKVYKMIPPMLESFHKGKLSSHWDIFDRDWMADNK